MSNISSYLAANGQVSSAFIASLSTSDVAGIAQALAGQAQSNTFVDQVTSANPAQDQTLSDNIDYTALDAAHASKLYTATGGTVLDAQISKLNAGQVSQIASDITAQGGTTSSGASIAGLVSKVAVDNPGLAKFIAYNTNVTQISATTATSLYNASSGQFANTQFAALNSAQVGAISVSETGASATQFANDIIAYQPGQFGNIDVANLSPSDAAGVYAEVNGAFSNVQFASLNGSQITAIAQSLSGGAQNQFINDIIAYASPANTAALFNTVGQGAFSNVQFGALSGAQVSAISQTQSVATATQFAYDIAAYNRPQFGNVDLSPLSTADTISVYSASGGQFSSSQLASLSPDKISAIVQYNNVQPSANWTPLSNSAAVALYLSQNGSISTTALGQLTTQQVAAIAQTLADAGGTIGGATATLFSGQIRGWNPAQATTVANNANISQLSVSEAQGLANTVDFTKVSAPQTAALYAAAGGFSGSQIASFSAQQVVEIAQYLPGDPAGASQPGSTVTSSGALGNFVNEVLGYNPGQVDTLADNVDFTHLDPLHVAQLYSAAGGFTPSQIASLNTQQVVGIAQYLPGDAAGASQSGSTDASSVSLGNFVNEILGYNPGQVDTLANNVDFTHLDPLHTAQLYSAAGGFTGSQIASLNSQQVVEIAQYLPGDAAGASQPGSTVTSSGSLGNFVNEILGYNPGQLDTLVNNVDFTHLDPLHTAQLYSAAGGFTASQIASLNAQQVVEIAQYLPGDAAGASQPGSTDASSGSLGNFVNEILGYNQGQLDTLVNNVDFTHLDPLHTAQLYSAAGGFTARQVASLNSQQVAEIASYVSGDPVGATQFGSTGASGGVLGNFVNEIFGYNQAQVGTLAANIDYTKLDGFHTAQLYGAVNGLISAGQVRELNAAQVASIAQSVKGSVANTFVDQVLDLNPSQAGVASDNIDYTQLDASHAVRLYIARGGTISASQVASLNGSQVQLVAQTLDADGGTASSGANVNMFSEQIVGLDPAQDDTLLTNTNFAQLDTGTAIAVYNAAGGSISAANVEQLTDPQVQAIASYLQSAGGSTSTGASASVFADQIAGLNTARIDTLLYNTNFAQLDTGTAIAVYNAAGGSISAANVEQLTDPQVQAIASYLQSAGGSTSTGASASVFADQIAGLNTARIDTLLYNTNFAQLDTGTAIAVYNAAGGSISAANVEQLTDPQVQAIASYLQSAGGSTSTGASASVFADQIAGLNTARIDTLLYNTNFAQLDTGTAIAVYNAAGGSISAANVEQLTDPQVQAIASYLQSAGGSTSTGASASVFADQIAGLNPARIGSLLATTNFGQLDTETATALYNAEPALLTAGNISQLTEAQVQSIGSFLRAAGGTTSTGASAITFANQIISSNPTQIESLLATTDFAQLDVKTASAVFCAAQECFNDARLSSLNSSETFAVLNNLFLAGQDVGSNLATSSLNAFLGSLLSAGNTAGLRAFQQVFGFTALSSSNTIALYRALVGDISSEQFASLTEEQYNALSSSLQDDSSADLTMQARFVGQSLSVINSSDNTPTNSDPVTAYSPPGGAQAGPLLQEDSDLTSAQQEAFGNDLFALDADLEQGQALIDAQQAASNQSAGSSTESNTANQSNASDLAEEIAAANAVIEEGYQVTESDLEVAYDNSPTSSMDTYSIDSNGFPEVNLDTVDYRQSSVKNVYTNNTSIDQELYSLSDQLDLSAVKAAGLFVNVQFVSSLPDGAKANTVPIPSADGTKIVGINVNIVSQREDYFGDGTINFAQLDDTLSHELPGHVEDLALSIVNGQLPANSLFSTFENTTMQDVDLPFSIVPDPNRTASEQIKYANFEELNADELEAIHDLQIGRPDLFVPPPFSGASNFDEWVQYLESLPSVFQTPNSAAWLQYIASHKSKS